MGPTKKPIDRTVVASFSNAEKMFAALQMRVDALEDLVEEAKAIAQQAAIMPRQPAPGDGEEDESSFSFIETLGEFFFIRGGTIAMSGRDSYSLPEDDSANQVEITGGTELAPGYVCLQMPTTEGPIGTTLVFLLTATGRPPDDNSTFIYYPLYTAWKDGAVAVKGKNIRPDMRLRSPI